MVLLPERFRAGCAFGAGKNDKTAAGLSLNKPWSGQRLYEKQASFTTPDVKIAP
jgi:hypothetical protein